MAADFFTTEVWTNRGLLTYYNIHDRAECPARARVGLDPAPGRGVRRASVPRLTADGDILRAGHVLICNRDPKWSAAMERLLEMVGVRVVRTPASAPNCNAYAERFIRFNQDRVPRIVSCPWASGIFGTSCESTWTTIARNGIIRASGTS